VALRGCESVKEVMIDLKQVEGMDVKCVVEEMKSRTRMRPQTKTAPGPETSATTAMTMR